MSGLSTLLSGHGSQESMAQPRQRLPSGKRANSPCCPPNNQVVGVQYYTGYANTNEMVRLTRDPDNPYDRWSVESGALCLGGDCWGRIKTWLDLPLDLPAQPLMRLKGLGFYVFPLLLKDPPSGDNLTLPIQGHPRRQPAQRNGRPHQAGASLPPVTTDRPRRPPHRGLRPGLQGRLHHARRHRLLRPASGPGGSRQPAEAGRHPADGGGPGGLHGGRGRGRGGGSCCLDERGRAAVFGADGPSSGEDV